MVQSEYDRVAGDLMALAREIETAKRPGYTVGSEDVLANFKAVAERAGITTEQAWTVYFLKHIDAITSIMTRPDLPVAEAAPGRFADAVNYLRLGFAIMREREALKPLEKPAGKAVDARSTLPSDVIGSPRNTPGEPEFETVGDYGQVRIKR